MEGNILEEARNSIGEFCMKECKAFCCRNGFIFLRNEKEINSVVGDRKEFFKKKGVLSKGENGFYRLKLTEQDPCPKLGKNFECTIHKDEDRPRVCKDYPVIPYLNMIFLSPYCKAVEQGKLKEHEKAMKVEGFNII